MNASDSRLIYISPQPEERSPSGVHSENKLPRGMDEPRIPRTSENLSLGLTVGEYAIVMADAYAVMP
jgi:hypothetical protein